MSPFLRILVITNEACRVPDTNNKIITFLPFQNTIKVRALHQHDVEVKKRASRFQLQNSTDKLHRAFHAVKCTGKNFRTTFSYTYLLTCILTAHTHISSRDPVVSHIHMRKGSSI
jgi:hypothetical protein